MITTFFYVDLAFRREIIEYSMRYRSCSEKKAFFVGGTTNWIVTNDGLAPPELKADSRLRGYRVVTKGLPEGQDYTLRR